MADHYTVVPKKEPPKNEKNFPKPEKRADQYETPIGPKKESATETVARYARSVKNKAREVSENPNVKKAVNYLRDRGENIAPTPNGRRAQATPSPQAKQVKPVGKIQPAPKKTKHFPPQRKAAHMPPGYVVMNGQTLAAQLDPFGIHGGIMDNYQKLAAPREGAKRDNKNPFGL